MILSLRNKATSLRFKALGGYDADAQAYFDRMDAVADVHYPESEKVKDNALIVAMKNGSIDFYAALKEMWLFNGGVYAAGRLGLKDVQSVQTMNSIYTANKYWTKYGIEGNASDVILVPQDFDSWLTSSDDYAVSFGISGWDGAGHVLGSQQGSTDRLEAFGYTGTSMFFYTDGGGRSGATPTGVEAFSRRITISADAVDHADITVDGVLAHEYSTGTGANLSHTAGVAFLGKNNNGTASNMISSVGTYLCVFDQALTQAQQVEFDGLIEAWLISKGRYVESELYDYFAALSTYDKKYVEKLSSSWIESGMTPTIFGLAKQAVFQSNISAADSVVDMTGNQDALDVNTPPHYSNGKESDGSTSYINTQINPNVDSTGSAYYSVGYLMVEPIDAAAAIACVGASAGSSDNVRLRTLNGEFQWRLDGNSIAFTRDGSETGVYLGVHDISNDNIKAFINEVDSGESTSKATGSSTNLDLHVMAQNGSGIYNVYRQNGWFILEDATEAQALIWSAFFRLAAVGLDLFNTKSVSQVESYVDTLAEDSSTIVGMQELRAKSDLIQEAVNYGEWSELDLLPVFATIEQSDANLAHDLKVGITHSASILNSITRDIEGIKGNATDMYVNLGYIPSVDGVNLAQNDFGIFVEIKEAPTSGYIYGTQGSSNNTRLRFETGASVQRLYPNSSSQLQHNELIADLIGDYTLKKTSATEAELFKNAVSVVSTSSLATSGISDQALTVMAYNNNATIASYCDAKVSLLPVGSSSISESNWETIKRNYLLRLKGFEIALAA